MDILNKIADDKRREVALKKTVVPIRQLEKSALFESTPHSLTRMLTQQNAGIIAEHKRRSPSKAVINQNLSVESVIRGYTDAGASCISVLTDGQYFGGSLDDLLLARACTGLPLLRKEFIINEYQLLEARSYGADVVLLIAALLSRDEISSLSQTAQSLGLEVLLEVHDEGELHKALMPSLNLIGVNNRNLKNFRVSLDTSKELAALIPEEFIRVSESGISSVAAIRDLCEYGYQGFLVGEHFMKSEDPGQTAANFIKQLET